MNLSSFTPAAGRALKQALLWSPAGDTQEITPEALLMGLLAESECRAAVTLARYHIDVAAVRKQWPELAENTPSKDITSSAGPALCHELEFSLKNTPKRLVACTPHQELATEHLLLGLVNGEHAVARWLRHQGLEPVTLEAEIEQRYASGQIDSGIAPPLAIPETDSPTQDDTQGISSHPTLDGDQANGCTASQAPLGSTVPTLRVVDAAANRAREGLRVVEDYCRFVLDDRHLTGLCKQLRHELTALFGRLPGEHLLAARETQHDVGTSLTADTEQRREDFAAVVRSNLVRVQEALRSLEEFGKLLDPTVAAGMKQLRYRAYTLQRAVETTAHSLAQLADARLYVLLDGRESPQAFEQMASALIEAGVDVVQLRDKRLDDRQLLQRGRILHRLTRGSRTLFIMNDRPDLAVLSGAEGVHVGQEELAVKDVRRIVGPGMLVGVSTHSLDQARQAVLDGADYIGVGPTFPSGTKQFAEFPGLRLLRAVAAEIRLPAFAIGGINPQNVGQVLSAGFVRIAVSGAITADDPAAAARELRGKLGDTEGIVKK